MNEPPHGDGDLRASDATEAPEAPTAERARQIGEARDALADAERRAGSLRRFLDAQASADSQELRDARQATTNAEQRVKRLQQFAKVQSAVCARRLEDSARDLKGAKWRMEQFRRLEAARATVDPKRLRRANEAVSLAQDWDTEARLSQEARSASDTRELAEARREYSASKQRVKGILRRQRSDAETNANQMRTVREAVLTAQRQLDRLADDGPSPLGSDLDHQQSTGTDAGVIPPAVSRRLTDFDSTLLPILLSAAQQLRRGGDDYPRYVASGFRYVLLEVVSAQSPPDGRSDRERVAELLKSTSWGVITDRVIGKLSGIMKARTSSAAEIEAAVHASYGSLRLLLESPAGAQGTIDAYSFVDRGISTE